MSRRWRSELSRLGAAPRILTLADGPGVLTEFNGSFLESRGKGNANLAPALLKNFYKGGYALIITDNMGMIKRRGPALSARNIAASMTLADLQDDADQETLDDAEGMPVERVEGLDR